MKCCCSENHSCINLKLLDPCLDKYADTEGSLITILQNAQEIYGYLPPDVLTYISDRTGVKPAKVLGVVTFYTQFRTKPVGKNLILICQGTACHVEGSADIEYAIREYLGVEEGEITEDGLFTYNNVACLGCCSLAPAIMIGSKTYGNLTRESTVKILTELTEAEKLAEMNKPTDKNVEGGAK